MRSFIIATMAFIALGAVAGASEAPKTYKDALATCSASWKAFKTEHAKVGGRDQWQEYRADCVAKTGYVVGGKGKIADRMSNDEFKALLAGGK